MHRRNFLQSLAALLGSSCLSAAERSPDVPWLDEVRRVPPGTATTGLASLLVNAAGQPIRTLAEWEPRRKELRAAWLEFLGPLSAQHLAAKQPAPPACTVLAEEQVDGLTRRLIRYEVENQQPVEAYLLIPPPADRPRPGVVVFHSTVPVSLRQPAGVEGAPEKAFGLQLAQRGCVALCPRNYLWPESHRIDARGEAARFLDRHPRSKGMDRMLLDGLIAVDILASLPEVDAARIGCIGHSLGAKEALYLAAFDDRLRAAVSSEGGVGISFSNWHDAWYLGESVRAPNFPREHHELLALAAPRPFLLVGGDSADGERSWPFIEAALPVYRLYGDSPRLGFYNHREGHSVPPLAHARMLEWLQTYL